ncbi:MAG: Dabb family protein [Nitrospirae bacterium]|nr:Dabb family protein [Nitrospirota bacterium]
MIKHIVLFKLKPEVSDGERRQLVEDLRGLKETTEGVMKECLVAQDMLPSERSYDIILDSTFDSLDHLQQYLVHPKHMEVVKDIRRLCASVAKVDYEV